MSKVNLNSVIFFRSDADRRPEDAEIRLEGIERFFKGITFPAKGRTFLYGHRNTALPYLLKLPVENGLSTATLDIHVEIGKWLRQKVDLSDDPEFGLKFTNFLSVARAKKPIMDLLESHWAYNLGESYQEREEWPRGATRHPELLDSLIERPEFKHLSVIAYTVKTAEADEFQVATVFNTDAIESVEGGWRFQEVQFVL